MPKLPRGTVTLLFTDVEGSTRLLQALGARYGQELEEHRRVVRKAVARYGGVEVDLLKGGRGADPRQQTLRATLEWSYELLDHDDREHAAMLLGAGDAVRRESGLAVSDVAEHDSILDAVRARTAAEEFATAWDERRRRTLDEAIAEAVDALSAPPLSLGGSD